MPGASGGGAPGPPVRGHASIFTGRPAGNRRRKVLSDHPVRVILFFERSFRWGTGAAPGVPAEKPGKTGDDGAPAGHGSLPGRFPGRLPGGNPGQPGATRGDPRQPEATRGDPGQPEATRGDPRRPGAFAGKREGEWGGGPSAGGEPEMSRKPADRPPVFVPSAMGRRVDLRVCSRFSAEANCSPSCRKKPSTGWAGFSGKSFFPQGR